MPLIRNGFLADNDVDLETMVRYYLVHPLLHFFNTVHWILNLAKILSQSKFSNHETPTPNLRSSKMVQRWKWVLTLFCYTDHPRNAATTPTLKKVFHRRNSFIWLAATLQTIIVLLYHEKEPLRYCIFCHTSNWFTLAEFFFCYPSHYLRRRMRAQHGNPLALVRELHWHQMLMDGRWTHPHQTDTTVILRLILNRK